MWPFGDGVPGPGVIARIIHHRGIMQTRYAEDRCGAGYCSILKRNLLPAERGRRTCWLQRVRRFKPILAIDTTAGQLFRRPGPARVAHGGALVWRGAIRFSVLVVLVAIVHFEIRRGG